MRRGLVIALLALSAASWAASAPARPGGGSSFSSGSRSGSSGSRSGSSGGGGSSWGSSGSKSGSGGSSWGSSGSKSGSGGSSWGSSGGGSSWGSSGGGGASGLTGGSTDDSSYSGGAGSVPSPPSSPRTFFWVLGIGVALMLTWVGWSWWKSRRQAEWLSTGAGDVDRRGAPLPARRALERLKKSDPAFSIIVLEDFLYALYTELQRARAGTLERFSAFTTIDARRALAPVTEVRDIVIGGMTFVDVQGADDPQARDVSVTVEFEVNFTEVTGDDALTYYVRDEWKLHRRKDAQSRTPDKASVLACPSCGAPLDVVIAGVCKHCTKVVGTGEVDWIVQSIHTAERNLRGPMLTGTTEERGTAWDTRKDAKAQSRLDALGAKDPTFTWAAFEARIGEVFSRFQIAWAARDLTAMRPLLSDRLFATQRYWTEAYTKQGLRNVTENARITRVTLARVTQDRFFDAITVRLHATGLDYTVDEAGKVVGGSRSKERAYSEYWTLIRGRLGDTPRPGTSACPHCGAPLAVSMAGNCTYCQVKVTVSDFDWVLSRIEQDESYEG